MKRYLLLIISLICLGFQFLPDTILALIAALVGLISLLVYVLRASPKPNKLLSSLLVCAAALALIVNGWLLIGGMPLGIPVPIDRIDSDVNVTLILPQGEGAGKSSSHELQGAADSEGIREVLELLEQTPVHRRLVLSGSAPVADSGTASLSVSFACGSRSYNLVWLDGDALISDIGSGYCAYSVHGSADDAFSRLCSIITQQG